MKNLFLLLAIITVSITSCSKNEETAVVVANPATQTCFLDSYNGTYIGQNASTFIGDATVKFTKTGCETCTFVSPEIGNLTVVGLGASSNGGYAGKLANGSGVAIAFNGTQISIQGENYSFGGTKQ